MNEPRSGSKRAIGSPRSQRRTSNVYGWFISTAKRSVSAKSWTMHADRELDRGGVHERAVGREERVLQVRLRDRAVADREHLAGRGVDLRVRRERMAQAPIRREDARRCRARAARPRTARPGRAARAGGRAWQTSAAFAVFFTAPSGLSNWRRSSRPRPERAAALALELEAARAHPAVAVARAAAVEAHRVQHPVAVEPVVLARRRRTAGSVRCARSVPSSSRGSAPTTARSSASTSRSTGAKFPSRNGLFPIDPILARGRVPTGGRARRAGAGARADRARRAARARRRAATRSAIRERAALEARAAAPRRSRRRRRARRCRRRSVARRRRWSMPGREVARAEQELLREEAQRELVARAVAHAERRRCPRRSRRTGSPRAARARPRRSRSRPRRARCGARASRARERGRLEDRLQTRAVGERRGLDPGERFADEEQRLVDPRRVRDPLDALALPRELGRERAGAGRRAPAAPARAAPATAATPRSRASSARISRALRRALRPALLDRRAGRLEARAHRAGGGWICSTSFAEPMR